MFILKKAKTIINKKKNSVFKIDYFVDTKL